VLGPAASAQARTADGSSSTVSLTLSMQNANVQQQDPATYDIVQAFMQKYPNVKITIQGQVVATHEQDMEIAAQTHTLPDIFWVYNSLAAPMSKDGDLLNLTPILTSLGITSDFPSNMLSGYQEGGIQYGLPYQSLVTGFYYNKAILAKYHLALPTTFAQLVNVVQVLHKAGVATIEQGANQSSFSVWAFLTMLDRFGYQSMYPSILAGKAGFDNPHFLALFDDIQTLAKDGAFNSNMTTETYVQAAQSFIAGDAAMFDSGVWQASQIQASSIGSEVGFWPGPTFPNGVGDQHILMNAPSAPLVVSAADKSNPARYNAIKEFIGFYYGSAGQQILVNNLQTPVTKYRPTGAAVKKPVFAAVLNEIRTPGWTSPQAQPDLVVSSATANAMYNSIYGVMEGVYSPAQALKAIQQSLKS
jgi:raffinose/stachyose/melibiose transport system substrate-binding protein